MTQLPTAVIGAGPIGLAAAAHLLERGEKPIVLEAGATVGASVLQWGHVRMFSPWKFNVDAACRRLLEGEGWLMPPADELPTGAELVTRYLQPLAKLPSMRSVIRTKARVTAISRLRRDKLKDAGRWDAPFLLRLQIDGGREEPLKARAVIDASGSWQQPNPLGADGIPALGETQLQGRIAYGIPDVLGVARKRYAGKRVAVVGSGHSAINTLLDLLRLRDDSPATEVVWALRGDSMQTIYGGGADDQLPARGQLGMRIKAAVAAGALEIAASFPIARVAKVGEQLQLYSDNQWLRVDEVIVCTGARPDFDILRELRLDIDPAVESARALAPMIDPNLHSCGSVPPHGEAELRQPERDFYIIGMKSYGRAPTFLLATGYEQARSITAALCGDWAAARAVQLNLPETGVCATDYADECCGEPALQRNVPSIALDEIPVAAGCC
ncbi:MAG: NAD(P)-binding domain-containing protein [Chloroflexi bacterium]|nr:NAD(P)-binding domain-containing protein [Chloroflexota bacterium]MCY4248002.1 NAD(P)-binding domain-containing protein [Chloroflexota bacterium]